MRVREGRFPRNADHSVTSRIHVDDLVQLLQAGLEADLQGAWPVADQEPCASMEIALWCARQFGGAMNRDRPESFSTRGRAVDGSEIFQRLRVEARWPTWRTGLPACIQAESANLER